MRKATAKHSHKTRLNPRDPYPHLPSLGTLFVDVLQVDLDHGWWKPLIHDMSL